MLKYLVFCFLFIFSCSSTQSIDESEPVQKAKPVPSIEFQSLVDEAQELRDLEFVNVPKLVRAETMVETLPSEIVSEVSFLKEVFGVDLTPTSTVRFVPKENTIEYVSQFSKGRDEIAIFRALVSALDAQQYQETEKAKSVDQYLATRVRGESNAAFLSVLRELKKTAPDLSSERIANRPESWMRTKFAGEDLVNKFIFRNAVVFGATMFRSNRIPGLEYGLSNGPTDSGSIKRPDRWLAGEGVGKWTFPKLDVSEGFAISQEGTLGPIFLEKWIGANPALSFWLSGSYRAYKADSQWLFEWVSMWETPTAASVAGKMLKEKFESQKQPNVTFSVVEFGNIVSVVGSLSVKQDEESLGKRAQALAKQSQVVFLSEEKPFLNFVPTSLDRLQTLKPQRKGLSAPGAVFNESVLEDWKVETPQSGLWWYATLGTEAIIQCNVELKPIIPPYVGDADYGKKWLDVFKGSVGSIQDEGVRKVDWNGVSAWEIDLKGKRSDADALRRIISRQYAIGEYIVSISLVSDPKDEKSVQTLTKLLESVKFTTLR